MKTIASFLLGLTVLASAVLPASAANCTVKGWTDGIGGHPIFVCPDEQR
jgi:hypothetical protein